jgi:hypothetical protein
MVTMEDGYLTIANASTIRALLDVSALSANRDFAFPNASGTLALTSDLNAYVPTTRTVNTTSPLTGGGALSSNLTLSIGQSTASTNGYLSSADWTTFNGKQNAITLTTTGTSGAATLVGSTLNIPNYADTDTGITSLNGLTALTQTFAVGTSGTDFGISSATSTHTFNLPTASATNRGALSSADWTTFNNKLNLSGGTLTGALEINNNALTQDGTRPIITLKQSGTSKLLLGISSAADDIIVGDVAGDVDFRTNSQAFNFSVNNGGSIAFKLASNAAATFSSSVTATQATLKANNVFNQDGDGQITIRGASVTDKALLIGFDTTSNYGYLQSIWQGNSAKPLVLQPFAGNVGIGTTSPSEELEVYKSQNDITRILVNNPNTTNTNSRASLSAISGTVNGEMVAITGLGLYLGASSNNFLSLITNGSSRLDITAGGNVLIGTTTDAGYKLDVNGTARVGVLTATLGQFSQTISTTSNAESSGSLNFLYATNANSRTWRLANDIDAYGDFAIQQSTTQSGSTFANKLIFSNAGAATFSSSVSVNGAGLTPSIGASALNIRETPTLPSALSMTNRNANQVWTFAVDTDAVDDGNFGLFNSVTSLNALKILPNGAATFSSSVAAGVGSTISGAANSDWGLTIENTGTTNAHGLYVNIGSASTGIPFRVDKNNSALFNIANTGTATFSGQVNIGNPVNAAVAVASTHKVTIVIGGVTYYLLATNV